MTSLAAQIEANHYVAFSAQESLRIISENLKVGLWRTNSGGQFVFANPFMGKIFGYEYHDFLGKSFTELEHLFSQDFAPDLNHHFKQMLNGFSGEFETEIVDTEDNHKYLRIAYFPIRNGIYLGSVGIVRDTTDTKKLLNELYELKG